MQAQDQDQMNALLELARAFARYDPKRAFDIIDPLVDQYNDLCTASRTLQGFGIEYYKNDELEMLQGNNIATLASNMSAALAALALTNFERAKTTTDRLRLAEVRVRTSRSRSKPFRDRSRATDCAPAGLRGLFLTHPAPRT
jgi:hypothetical protein